MTLKPPAHRNRAAIAAPLALLLTLHFSALAAATLTEPPLSQTNNPSMAALDRIGRQIARRICDRPQVVDWARAASASAGPSAGRVAARVVYSCPGYRVVAERERSANATSEFLTAVEVSAPHPAVDVSIGVGADVRSVIQALGAPDTVNGDDLVYPLSSDQADAYQASIRIRNEHVVAITWRWPAR
jgi:hypothetical protein